MDDDAVMATATERPKQEIRLEAFFQVKEPSTDIIICKRYQKLSLDHPIQFRWRSSKMKFLDQPEYELLFCLRSEHIREHPSTFASTFALAFAAERILR